jgi:acyl-CoA thioester hydrolase
MYEPTTKTYSFPVTVEFEDVDSYHIVHNTRIIDYFERARVHFISEVMKLDLYPAGLSMVLYSLDVRFTKAARLLDRLTARVFVASLDDYRLTLGYRLFRGDDALARGSSGIAFMDAASGNLIKAPTAYVDIIRPFIRSRPTGSAA